MTSAFEKGENMLLRALKSGGLDQKYGMKRLLMSTGLYSVYLVSDKEQTRPKDVILLVEHLPAKEPSAHLLPMTINESASQTEKMQDVVDAVQDFFAENESL